MRFVSDFSDPEPSRNFSMTILNPGEPAESEDCLYLNVFTPARATPASGFAVMFWIYGGNLQSGTSTYSFYDGSSFAANQDVIIVTVNYRTNGECGLNPRSSLISVRSFADSSH